LISFSTTHIAIKAQTESTAYQPFPAFLLKKREERKKKQVNTSNECGMQQDVIYICQRIRVAKANNNDVTN
jgi:hypothetical protein